MNQDIKKSRQKYAAMVDRLIAAARASQNAADMFDESLGKLFGANRTDGRCADIIQRHGRMSAGELAEHAGLTTGAVTTVLDRLEKAGVARRVRDEKDRRKVYVELTEFSRELAGIVFSPMGEAFGEAMKDVPLEDIRIIAQYLEFTERVNRAYAAILAKHVSEPGTSTKDRLARAEQFARESRRINPGLVQSWGQVPAEPPRTGKPPAIEMLEEEKD